MGKGCIGIECDVSTIEGAREFVAKATAALGHIDILVANGGGPKPGTFTSIDIEDYQPALER
ncbi:MAG: SDR family NAD(P)-dependent oxidoreductase, partial [Rhodobacteraceae bacterium]|nr:SDR family NAD(P)-dependent oxidoreductase [Paracoccaceae bacterium]